MFFQQGIWDRPKDDHENAIDPNDYMITLPVDPSPSDIQSDLIARADSHYVTRALKLCKETILSSTYPSIRVDLEEFIESFVSYSTRLRTAEIDRTQPQAKQKSQAKNILQQKRLALSDYFKALTNYGISHRVGTLAWKNKLEEVLDFTIPPLEISAGLPNDKRMLSCWNGCNR